jgi:ATP-binding cassette subfamily B protein
MQDLRIVWRLTKLTFKYPWLWVIALVATVGHSAMAVVPNEAIRYAIDEGLVKGGGYRVLVGAGVVILLAALVRGGFAFGQQFFGQMLSQRIAYDIRNALYNQIQRLSSAFHDKAQTGQLMSRATKTWAVA